MKLYYSLLASFILLSCANQHKATSSSTYVTTPSGLKYAILQKGSGETAKEGQEVLIFETTSYLNGTVLYSNENTTNPVKVLIGGHQATEGVDEGLRGMKVGEVRRLIAPPQFVRRKSYPTNVSLTPHWLLKLSCIRSSEAGH